MFRQILRLCWVASLSLVLGEKLAAQDFLDRPHRPSIEEVAHYLSEIEASLGPCGPSSSSEQEVFALYRAIVERLRERFPTEKLVFFGRDLEGLYDAHQLLASPEEKARAFLAPISRPLAQHSSAAALTRLMALLGSDVPRLAAGTEKVLWLDTGARGTIYNHLLYALFLALGEGARMNERRALLEGVRPLLLQSRGEENLPRLIGRILASQDPHQVRDWFLAERRYDALDAGLLSRHGVPEDFYYRSKWLVHRIEHAPKWNPRTSLVDEQGRLHFEPADSCMALVDRHAHLCLQVRLARYFEPSLRSR